MTVLRRLASLLMSSTPGRKRREQQPHHPALQHSGPSADDGSLHAGKRSRSGSGPSSAGLGAAAAAADTNQVVDLTDDATPEPPARHTGTSRAQAAAAPAAAAGGRAGAGPADSTSSMFSRYRSSARLLRVMQHGQP